MIKLIYPKLWTKRTILSVLLIPLSWIYILLGYLRKISINKVILPVKVICVGNITVGGTGKTQLVIWLANSLKKRNINFVIITKAYGSNLAKPKIVTKQDSPEQVGDESIVLREFGTVIASPRVKDAIDIIKSLNPQIIIVDDGMQNPNFHKDLTIMTIDNIRGIGNGFIFPAGPMRQELEEGINNADIIMMIGNKACNDSKLITKLLTSSKPLLTASIALKTKLTMDKKYLAFTAIGNPDKFYNLLEEHNIKVESKRSFPDHHFFSHNELKALTLESQKSNLHLITTKKDYVKLDNNKNITCIEIDLVVKHDKELFKLIDEKILYQN